MNKIVVKLSYKASGLYAIDTESLNDLCTSLKSNYITNIRPNNGPQAGGVVDCIIELIFDISFVDFFKIIRDGLIFDLVTRGKDSFILKPLFDAFKAMESKNPSWDYTKVKFLFDDTEVVIYGMSNLFTSKLGLVLNLIAKYYNFLIDKDLGAPYQILIPIVKDVDSENNEFYANYGGGSEFEIDDYQKYWGLVYQLGFEAKIFDLKEKKILNMSWKY